MLLGATVLVLGGCGQHTVASTKAESAGTVPGIGVSNTAGPSSTVPGVSIEDQSGNIVPATHFPWPEHASVTATDVAAHRDIMQGVHLDPPLPTTPRGPTTAAQAVALCNSTAACYGQTLPSRIEFGLFTDESYGPRAVPITQTTSIDHISIPVFVKRPSLIMTWHNVTCLNQGGATSAGSASYSPPPPASYPCDFVTLVDAASGSYDLAYQGPADPALG
jgi:hypothetical protein